MKALIEKQILEWQQEIIKQNTYVMRLEGGIQAYQLLLQKMNEEEEKTGNIELGVKNEKSRRDTCKRVSCLWYYL